MGYANEELLKRLDYFRRVELPTTPGFLDAVNAVNQSQTDCTHALEDQVEVLPSKYSKVKLYCRRCSKVLEWGS